MDFKEFKGFVVSAQPNDCQHFKNEGALEERINKDTGLRATHRQKGEARAPPLAADLVTGVIL